MIRPIGTILQENLSLGYATRYTVKPVLSGQSKIDKTKVLKTDGSLLQVESIAEFFNLHY